MDTLKRPPILDEYDFYDCLYLDSEDQTVEIRLKVILTDLSATDQLRFKDHLRAWYDDAHNFADSVHDSNPVGNGSKLHWVLPVVFIGRYDKNERDFVAGTFFDYPLRDADDGKYLDRSLGDGRIIFGWADKRHCRFIFLGSDRTTAQLLSLHGGSLMERLIDFSKISLAGDRMEQRASPVSESKEETALPYNYGDRSHKTHPLSDEAAHYLLENVSSCISPRLEHSLKALAIMATGLSAQPASRTGHHVACQAVQWSQSLAFAVIDRVLPC